MIRPVTKKDKDILLEMLDEFYHSSAVLHPIPKVYYQETFEEMLQESPYVEGYIVKHNGEIAGYGIVSKTFSSEVGGLVVWIEELYIRDAYRSHGLGSEFFAYLEKKYGKTAKRLRLEVERSNERAVALYERLGFEELPYQQMIKEY